MKKYFLNFIFTTLIFTGFAQKQVPEYQWINSSHRGGGYVTGIMQHPTNPSVIYIRTDVAGMYRSDNAGKTWSAINNGMTDRHHHCVETFALSAQKPDLLFRASGEARNHQMVGAIHKSTNGGKTWKLVTEKPDFFGNGYTRYYGEKMAVNPFNSKIVVAASNTRGIWRSTDEGESWNYVGFKDEPFCVLTFDPYRKNRLYAATLDILENSKYLYPNGSNKRERIGKLFFSNDNGKTWKLLFAQKRTSFTNLIFNKDEPNTILATFKGNGIFKSIDGGKSFIKKTIEFNQEDFPSINADPNNSNVYYAARGFAPLQPKPTMPLYKSTDKGETWTLINKDIKWSDFKNFPEHIDRPTMLGWAISKFIVDNKNPDKFYASNWFGIYQSPDAGKTWDGNNFDGLENVCLETIVADSNDPSRVYFAGADGQPCVSRDGGLTYTSLPAMISIHLYYCGTAITASKFKKDFLLYGVSNNAEHTAAINRSEDDGKHVEFSIRLGKGYFVHDIKEDNFIPGVFYAYIDGAVKDSAGLYKTTDWAKTWTKMNLQLPKEVKTLPFRQNFIESELLSVTYYQVKNACGANQLLLTDPTRPNTIYFGEADKGIFATFDGGKSWKNIGKGLPFGRNVAGILNVIKADPKRAGWLYAGFIHEGLWCSKNFGETWKKIFPIDNSVFNATSVAVGGPSGNEVYVACETLFWSKAPSAVYASFDIGKSWKNIYDPTLGSIRWKGIDIDNHTGVLYAVSCGNGAFIAKPKR